METPSLLIAFAAGLLSFLSPCVLPLVPAYIGYLGGSAVRSVPAAATVTAGPGGRGRAVAMPAASPSASARWMVLTHAVVFVLGFTLVFAIIGGLLGSMRDLLLSENPLFHISNRRILQYIMGVLLVVFGLHMVGLVNIPFLNYERRLGDKLRPGPNLSYLRSFLIGLGFGLGWTPCIGPTLGLIFGLALNGQQTDAILPFLFYSVGLGVPFMLTALAMGRISTFLKKLTRRSYSLKIGSWTAIGQVNVVSLVSGGLLIIMGVLIFTNWLSILAPPVAGIGDL
ncbi:MAG: cytochrome c biogenesis protein CcdA [Chloroflexota bacterium]